MYWEKSESIEAGLQNLFRIPEETPENVQEKSVFSRVKSVVFSMTVEPVLVFYIIPSMMITIAVQNLNLEKACRVNLGISVEHCDALTNRNESAYPEYKQDEERIQTLATFMTIIKNAVQSIIPGIILLFLGAWSDKFHKRKPCMLVPILGDMSCVIGLIICTYFYYEFPIEINSIFESVFPAISGTWFAMFTGVYSYISDISNEEERTVRVGTINMLTNVSMCIGTALSGILYTAVGFYWVYVIALLMYSIAFIYGYFFISDICVNSSGEGEKDAKVQSQGFCRDFFQTGHIVETFKTATKSDGNNRGRGKRVCAIIFLFVVIVGPLYGEVNVVYFFVRFQFGWDSIEYSFFSTFQFVTNTLGTVFSLWFFNQFLKVDDSILGIISCSTKVLACGVYAFATGPFTFYLGAVVEILNGTSFVAMRAMVTKLVLPEELGKINSLFGIFEAVVPLIYGPLYSRIYALTIDYFPGCFYIVGGGLTFPALFIFYWLYTEHKKDLKMEALSKEQGKKLLQIQEVIPKSADKLATSQSVENIENIETSGSVDFKGTFERIWDNHLTELVTCSKCGRKFFPDRIEKHKEVCIGLKINVKNSSKNRKTEM